MRSHPAYRSALLLYAVGLLGTAVVPRRTSPNTTCFWLGHGNVPYSKPDDEELRAVWQAGKDIAAGGVCLCCGKKFRLYQKRDPGMPARSSSIHYIDKAGHFCSLRCAAEIGTLLVNRNLGAN